MIIFDLKCVPQGHVFEGWFGSSADYEEQQGRGLVSCPLCGAGEVAKAVMAPAVGAKGNRAPAAAPVPELFSGDPEKVKTMLASLAAEQKKMLASSEHVGDRFADEARAIHLGDAEARAIHGRATRDQAEGLIDDGIPIAPLPFPVVEPGEEN
ncbi:MAG TPA: DUF1178 family protein [Allosphingosinicella sp.]|jgi:hypothetical protein